MRTRGLLDRSQYQTIRLTSLMLSFCWLRQAADSLRVQHTCMHTMATSSHTYLKEGIFICYIINHDCGLTVSIVDRAKSVVPFLTSCVLECDSERSREGERKRERERERERERDRGYMSMYDITAATKLSTLYMYMYISHHWCQQFCS